VCRETGHQSDEGSGGDVEINRTGEWRVLAGNVRRNDE